MYKVLIELKLKKDIPLKDSYEKVAYFIRSFINENNGIMKENHYVSQFSYYSFSTLFPKEEDAVYKKGYIYTVEIRSINKEFLDIKQYAGLENEDMVLLSASAGKLYYRSKGVIVTETPAFMKTKPIRTAEDMEVAVERVRENIVFRYLKSGMNQSDDIALVRNDLVETITINPKFITIPYYRKQTRIGKPILYHCLHIKVEFKDNVLAKEAEQVIYSSGLGKNTSNGFGFIQ